MSDIEFPYSRSRITGDLYYQPTIPPGAVWAARGRRNSYENPHRVRRPCKACDGAVHATFTEALAEYDAYLAENPLIVARALSEPPGTSFACWCKPHDRCHVDILLAHMARAMESPADQRR